MFQNRVNKTKLGGATSVLELIYHNTVRAVRSTHANAVLAIVLNIAQMAIMVMSFYLLFVVLGMRGAAIRGDFMLYLMSGIFLYIVHIRTVTAIFKSEGPTSGMMQHAPMTTAVTIMSAAFSTLYIQILSVLTVLYIYHVGWGPIHIHQWAGAFGMVLLSWFFGVAVGLVFLSLKPWIPDLISKIQLIYTRASMITSGKMFVANAMPGYMVGWFDWNPLFHVIDQTRGFLFINYFPHNSNVTYPVVASLVVLMVGLMGEHFTRRNSSLSWGAGR